MENNNVSIKKSTLWKGTAVVLAVVLIAVLIFFALKGNFGNGVTGNAVGISANAVAKELSLKELCAQDGNMFMTMRPVLNGVPTGEPACPGCMIGNNHICDIETYLKVSGR